MKLNLFVPITKVDVEKREVWGRAVQEVPDKSKEIFDYATSAPLFRDWSAGFEKATEATGQEKSLGNIRAMHGKVAAGKVSQIDFNDAEKAIDICATIVDDAEWAKCQSGVYTGFSIGGSYAKKWKDGDDPTLSRYTAQPAEISIVDNPCVPTARFQMVKADGVVEEKEFKAPDPAAEKVEGIPDATGEPAEVKKSMYGVASLASLLSSAATETMMAQWEADAEGDKSPVPAALRSWLADGLKILNAMAAEESAELMASITPKDAVVVEVVELAAGGDLAKADTLKKHAQSVHDSAIAMGASCSSTKADESGDLTKITGELATANESLAKLATENTELKAKVVKLEAEPAPAKGVTKVIAKEDDSVVAEKKEEVEDKSPLGLMKKAHAAPKLIKL